MSELDESDLRARFDAGDTRFVATEVLRRYGPGIGGFLRARLRNPDDAQEVFAMFCEDLWKGLPGFAWRRSLRGWAYTLARHAESRFRKLRGRRERRQRALSEAPAEMLAAAEHVRTTTMLHQRTEVKDRMRELRSRLDEADQLALVLRVDKGLPWNEVVHVLSEPGEELDDAAVRREAARLRKRFQLVKEKLRGWAQEEGLL